MHPGGAQALFGIRRTLPPTARSLAAACHRGHVRPVPLDGRPRWRVLAVWRWKRAGGPGDLFRRHVCSAPLTLSAAKASLLRMKNHPEMYDRLNSMTEDLRARANAIFRRENVPYWLVNSAAAGR